MHEAIGMCAFCGERYRSGSPIKALKKHIAQCPQQPEKDIMLRALDALLATIPAREEDEP